MTRLFRKIAKLVSRRERNLRRYRRLWATGNVDSSCVLLEQQGGLTANGNIYHVAREIASSSTLTGFTAHFVAEASRLDKLSKELTARGLAIDIVERRSRRYYELLATAGHLICDTSFPPEFAKRPGQILINTWHGTPLKTLGRLIPGESRKIGNVQKSFMSADYVLCPNTYTAEKLACDYMFDGFAPGSLLMGAYPRNAALFSDCSSTTGDICRYAYMPTFRTSSDGSRDGAVNDIAARLAVIDVLLDDNEELFTQLHPVVGAALDFSAYRHIRPFPSGVETYDFLASCDVLVTDYSSVMFDFAATGRKVVLFAFDEDRYFADRGFYMKLDDLPFPRTGDEGTLVNELRQPKSYDDTLLMERFCPFDSPLATKEFCDRILLGYPSPAGREKPIRRADHRALVYIDSAPRCKLASVIAGVKRIAESYEVLLAFPAKLVEEQPDLILEMPDRISFLPIAGSGPKLLHERVADKLAGIGLIGPHAYSFAMRNWHEYELARRLCGMSFDLLVCSGSDWRTSALLANVKTSRKVLILENSDNWPRRMRKAAQQSFNIEELIPSTEWADLS